jgi:serine/threonine-protein kinase
MTHAVPELKWTIPRPGETVAGKYVVDGPCGRGGLAIVLAATHTGLDQRVALKMLLPEWAGDADVVERFLREGRAATRIRSEHVVRVFDVGELESGAPFIVLEFLEGHSLDDVLATWGALPVPTAIDWVLQAAEAIGEAHSYGIVHRDLKPANLFLTRRADGSACIKVIDFGLSKVTDPRMSGASLKLTRPTDVMGSPHYMAPEQLRATRDADTRADIWALGAVLYELLTGRPPFRGASVPEICAGVLTQAPPPIAPQRASVPPLVEQAVMRCLEKDPTVRFGTAAELARALAPFGTTTARTSAERIERTLEGGVVTGMSLLPPLQNDEVRPRDSWPSDVMIAPPGGVPLRVIVGACLILIGVGAGILMWMYESVHAGDPKPVGVVVPQPRAPAVTVTTATAPGTVAETAMVAAGATATASPTTSATASATATAPQAATAPVARPVWRPQTVTQPRAAPPAPARSHDPMQAPRPLPTAPARLEDVFDGRK